MNVKSKKVPNLVTHLSRIINEVRNGSQPIMVNEEWTKIVLILPLLEGLGWDRTTDIIYGQSVSDSNKQFGFILRCRPPIIIETRSIGELPPHDLKDDYIAEKLKNWKQEGISRFIWTNGDCWRFFSLDLAKAPVYQVNLSQNNNVHSVAEKFNIIKKDSIIDNEESFNQAIHENWKIIALTNAWEGIHKSEDNRIELIKQDLPIELEFEDEEIRTFLSEIKCDHSAIPKNIHRILPEPRWPLADDHDLSCRAYTKDKPIDIVRDLKTVYEKALIFIQAGFFWEVYDEDAHKCSKLFGWKVVPFGLDSVFTGTPTNSFRFKEKLEDEGISYIMVAQNEYPASHPLSNRRVIEFFDPVGT